MVKMLTVLISTISNSQVFLLKNVSKMQKLLIFFSKNISVYAIFNDQSFNDMLSNNIISFEQLGPDKYFFLFLYKNIQSNLNSSNTDGSFTMANWNSF